MRPAICHPDRPYVARGMCNACICRDAYLKRMAKMTPEKWAIKRLNDRIVNLASRIKRPTHEVRVEVMALLEQSDKCEICGTIKDLCIDHDHKTGRVRGILCRIHNCLIGFAQENEDILHNANRYLMRKQLEQTPNDPSI